MQVYSAFISLACVVDVDAHCVQTGHGDVALHMGSFQVWNRKCKSCVNRPLF